MARSEEALMSARARSYNETKFHRKLARWEKFFSLKRTLNDYNSLTLINTNAP